MSNRAYLEEILSIKSRIHKSKRWDLVLFHMRAMSECSEIIEIVNNEEDYLEKKHSTISVRRINYIDQFFPIKCVACIEGYFRLLIADLIDFGSPFRDNAKNFSDVKFSIDTVLSLQMGKVSVGDFISHLLPIKSFANVCSIMTTLIGKDFKEELKTIYLNQPNIKPLFGTQEDIFNGIIKGVSAMFKYRHIYCHELGDIEQAITGSGFVQSTAKFLYLTELIAEEIMKKKKT
jgi:hypothetical protein